MHAIEIVWLPDSGELLRGRLTHGGKWVCNGGLILDSLVKETKDGLIKWLDMVNIYRSPSRYSSSLNDVPVRRKDCQHDVGKMATGKWQLTSGADVPRQCQVPLEIRAIQGQHALSFFQCQLTTRNKHKEHTTALVNALQAICIHG